MTDFKAAALSDFNETSSELDSAADSSSDSDVRQCWICYVPGSSEDPRWRSPCACRGTSRWVHEECLLRWIDERQRGHSPDSDVFCPQCKLQYQVCMPLSSRPESILNSIDNAVSTLCPVVAVVALGGAMVYCSFKYGEVCLRVVLDSREADEYMVTTPPLHRTIVLTLLPISLLGIGKWNLEVRFARGVSWLIRTVRMQVGGFIQSFGCPTSHQGNLYEDEAILLEDQRILPPTPDAEPDEIVIDSTTISSFLVNSLSLPFIASVFGWVFFDNLPWCGSKKTVCGGLLYIALKGSAVVYKQMCQEARFRQRTVLDCRTASSV